MQPLTPFLTMTVDIPQDFFLSKYPHPFLITSKKHLQQMKNLANTPFPVQGDRFSTMISNVKSTKMEKEWLQAAWVCPIRSQKGGEMQMVNLGRTGNNDIIIPLPVVSKFHCCFLIYGPQEVYLIDGGSTNKTFLNESPLEANQKNPIKSRDLIRFGTQLEFEFYFPADLFQDLQIFRNIFL